jgi:hypothetical protein
MVEGAECFVIYLYATVFIGFIDVFLIISKPYTIKIIHETQKHAKDNWTKKP